MLVITHFVGCAGTPTRLAPYTRSLLKAMATQSKRRLSHDTTSASRSSKEKRPRLTAPSTSTLEANDSDTSCGSMSRNWPAPESKMESARNFIRDCVGGGHLTLLVPDKDADGLSSGKIMHHTLLSMGLPSDKIKVHMLAKSASVFQDDEKNKMDSYGATRVIFMDQGSRGGPSLVNMQNGNVKVLILDHHESDEFPDGALAVSACRSPPVATSSLLTYLVCEPLHSRTCTNDICATFALLGFFGDMGSGYVKSWNDDPWPSHLGAVMKRVTKKALTDAVSKMNAPRRLADYPVSEAWEAILASTSPKDISSNPTFIDARLKVNVEVERCMHTSPKFSKDGRVAVFRISSGFQVHPVIATRWAGHLKGKNLQVVMVANSGYHPSNRHTNFSCRVTAPMRKLPDSERPNIIELLLEYGRKVPDSASFFERVGGDFAKGHKEASGGIILNSDFELLMSAMEVGVKPSSSSSMKGKRIDTPETQKLKVTDFFSRKM